VRSTRSSSGESMEKSRTGGKPVSGAGGDADALELGLAGRGAIELSHGQWRAAKLPVAEATDRSCQSNRHPVRVEVGDDRELVLEVTGPDKAVEHHRVPHTEVGDGGRRVDCVQQLAPSPHSVCDRDEVFVKLTSSDRIQQPALGRLQRPVLVL